MSLNLKYRPQMGKDLFGFLLGEGHLVYGGAFPAESVHRELDIVIPEVGTKAMFAALALIELAAVGYVKEQLLKQGMYLKKDGESYRILLASENADQIRNYQASADRKLLRALKLSKNSPDRTVEHDKKEVRLVMQRASIREDMRQAAHMQ